MSEPEPIPKRDEPEEIFRAAMGKILSVSKEEILRREKISKSFRDMGETKSAKH